MPEGENPEGAAAAPEAAHEEVRSNFGLFRRPEKFKIGEDFDCLRGKLIYILKLSKSRMRERNGSLFCLI